MLTKELSPVRCEGIEEYLGVQYNTISKASKTKRIEDKEKTYISRPDPIKPAKISIRSNEYSRKR